MTHDKLLVKLMVMGADESEQMRLSKTTQALRAIIQLHQQINGRQANCVACFMNTYDCPTIQAIEKELA